VPIYPEGVGYLAATLVVTDGARVRVGRPPADPLPLLSEVRTALSAIPGARQASRAWLSVPDRRHVPGENAPDQVDAWISAYAEPFYIRS
jgi:hypothetical protein